MPELYGTNPYGYQVMPWDIFNSIYGQAPQGSEVPPPSFGGMAGPTMEGLYYPNPTPNQISYPIYDNYTPFMDVPLVPPPGLPDVTLETPNQNELGFPGSDTPLPPAGGTVSIYDLTNPPYTGGPIVQTPTTPTGTGIPRTGIPAIGNAPGVAPGAPPVAAIRPGWTQNPPGVTLTPQDRFRMGQDVDPRSGTGTPGNYNPYGPGGPPGTLGIVSPSSPAGGGSFFGGHSSNPFGLPGSSYGLGAGGYGNLGPLAWQLAMFHGLWSGAHPYSQNTWNANAGWRNYQGRLPGAPAPGGIGGSYANYLNIWNSLRNRGVTAQGGQIIPGGTERSGQGPGGAGRPPTSAT